MHSLRSLLPTPALPSSALQNADFCSATYAVIYPTAFLDSNNLFMPLSAWRPPSPPFFILKPKLFLEPRSPANPTQPFLAASRQKHLPNSHPPEPLESMFMMHLVENTGPFYLHRVFLDGTHHVRFITLAQKHLLPCLRDLRWTRVKKIFAEWVYTQILDNYKLNPSQIKLPFKGRIWVVINLKWSVWMYEGERVRVVQGRGGERETERHRSVTKTIAEWSPSSQINKYCTLPGMFRKLGKEPHKEPWGGTNLAHQVLLWLINPTFPWVWEYY